MASRIIFRLCRALLFAFVLYLLCYPAFLRYQYGYRTPVLKNEIGCALVNTNDAYDSLHSHTIFVPVEFLIDSTVLYEPMLVWAKCFGSQEKMRYDSISRRISRRLGTPIRRTASITGSDYANSSPETWASLTENRNRSVIEPDTGTKKPK